MTTDRTLRCPPCKPGDFRGAFQPPRGDRPPPQCPSPQDPGMGYSSRTIQRAFRVHCLNPPAECRQNDTRATCRSAGGAAAPYRAIVRVRSVSGALAAGRGPRVFGVEGTGSLTRHWAEAWQQSWDRLEERLVPDRELWLGALLDAVDAAVEGAPTVVDLACGTGTVTRRLLERRPAARSIAVDVDPVLLTIASATFAEDDRVQVVPADLRHPRWIEALPVAEVDAVVTTTSLHWLSQDVVRRLYADLAELVRPGGVVAHAEVMPLADSPVLNAGLARLARDRRSTRSSDDREAWEAWWRKAAQDPALTAATQQRHAIFPTSYPVEEFSPPAEWHIAALHHAGFVEASLVWRAGPGAVVAAVRSATTP